MTRLALRPYQAGDSPGERSVPVCVVVLTKDEEVNIARCLTSVSWAEQIVVIDSGSSDSTVPIARSLGADVVLQAWLGYSEQREFALRIPLIRYDWIYFVDADEWVSSQLASEIAVCLQSPLFAGFSHRLRLVFQGKWIRHCGWYTASLVVRLVDRRYAKFNGAVVGERACVDGPVGRLQNDIVDQDLKGLATWLHKHIRYAELQAEQRGRPIPFSQRLYRLRHRDRTDSRPLVRALLRDVIFPSVPAKPLALFVYMYVVRLGFLDGIAGLRFCFFHAWYEASIAALQPEERQVAGRKDRSWIPA
jgi:glycosyltransferase involved in cell wall biosynthesis